MSSSQSESELRLQQELLRRQELLEKQELLRRQELLEKQFQRLAQEQRQQLNQRLQQRLRNHVQRPHQPERQEQERQRHEQGIKNEIESELEKTQPKVRLEQLLELRRELEAATLTDDQRFHVSELIKFQTDMELVEEMKAGGFIAITTLLGSVKKEPSDTAFKRQAADEWDAKLASERSQWIAVRQTQLEVEYKEAERLKREREERETKTAREGEDRKAKIELMATLQREEEVASQRRLALARELGVEHGGAPPPYSKE